MKKIKIPETPEMKKFNKKIRHQGIKFLTLFIIFVVFAQFMALSCFSEGRYRTIYLLSFPAYIASSIQLIGTENMPMDIIEIKNRVDKAYEDDDIFNKNYSLSVIADEEASSISGYSITLKITERDSNGDEMKYLKPTWVIVINTPARKLSNDEYNRITWALGHEINHYLKPHATESEVQCRTYDVFMNSGDKGLKRVALREGMKSLVGANNAGKYNFGRHVISSIW